MPGQLFAGMKLAGFIESSVRFTFFADEVRFWLESLKMLLVLYRRLISTQHGTRRPTTEANIILENPRLDYEPIPF